MIETLIGWLEHQFQNNDVFAGLLGGSIVASGLYTLRGIPARVANALEGQFTVRLVVTNDDAAFEGLAVWLSQTAYARSTRRLRLTSEVGEDAGWILAPGQGWHLLWSGGRPIFLSRSTNDAPAGTTSHRMREQFTIITPGRSQARIRALLAEAQKLAAVRDDMVRAFNWSGYWWDSLGFKPVRPLDSVVLAEGQTERIIADAQRFLGARSWYRERGIPYRRGYLLSGPPGTGKSSLVNALAGHFGMPIYSMNLSVAGDDNALLSAFSRVPAGAILLIEDVDAVDTGATQAREEPVKAAAPLGAPQPASPERKGVTLSGLLNAIDGVVSPEGRLLFMTSNHESKLDPALVRPGRIDLHERLGLAGPEEARRMFARFYGAEEAARLNGDLQGREFSPARLQQVFMAHERPAGALAELSGGVHGR